MSLFSALCSHSCASQKTSRKFTHPNITLGYYFRPAHLTKMTLHLVIMSCLWIVLSLGLECHIVQFWNPIKHEWSFPNLRKDLATSRGMKESNFVSTKIPFNFQKVKLSRLLACVYCLLAKLIFVRDKISAQTLNLSTWWGFNPVMPMFKGFRFMERMWALGGFDGFRQKQGAHRSLPRLGPPEGKDLHPACLILYCFYSWSCYNCA
jgi:hypothetical protein